MKREIITKYIQHGANSKSDRPLIVVLGNLEYIHYNPIIQHKTRSTGYCTVWNYQLPWVILGPGKSTSCAQTPRTFWFTGSTSDAASVRLTSQTSADQPFQRKSHSATFQNKFRHLDSLFEFAIVTKMNPRTVQLYRKSASWQLGIIIVIEVAVFVVALFVWSSHFTGVRDELQHQRPFSFSHIQTPRLGAVSSMSAACSKAGARILKAGGNAADAVRSTLHVFILLDLTISIDDCH